MATVTTTDRVFCPECRSKNTECVDAETPEWMDEMNVGAKERYFCKNCKEFFSILTTYRMVCFNFEGSDEDIMVEV